MSVDDCKTLAGVLVSFGLSADKANCCYDFPTYPDTNQPRLYCDGNGRITKLGLDRMNVDGLIPEAISSLTALQWLNLANNSKLHSSIPASLIQLPSLISLFIDHTSVSGQLPPKVGRNLNQISFSSTKLTGVIPTEWLSNTSVLVKGGYCDFGNQFCTPPNSNIPKNCKGFAPVCSIDSGNSIPVAGFISLITSGCIVLILILFSLAYFGRRYFADKKSKSNSNPEDECANISAPLKLFKLSDNNDGQEIDFKTVKKMKENYDSMPRCFRPEAINNSFSEESRALSRDAHYPRSARKDDIEIPEKSLQRKKSVTFSEISYENNDNFSLLRFTKNEKNKDLNESIFQDNVEKQVIKPAPLKVKNERFNSSDDGHSFKRVSDGTDVSAFLDIDYEVQKVDLEVAPSTFHDRVRGALRNDKQSPANYLYKNFNDWKKSKQKTKRAPDSKPFNSSVPKSEIQEALKPPSDKIEKDSQFEPIIDDKSISSLYKNFKKWKNSEEIINKQPDIVKIDKKDPLNGILRKLEGLSSSPNSTERLNSEIDTIIDNELKSCILMKNRGFPFDNCDEIKLGEISLSESD